MENIIREEKKDKQIVEWYLEKDEEGRIVLKGENRHAMVTIVSITRLDKYTILDLWKIDPPAAQKLGIKIDDAEFIVVRR